MRGDEPCRGRQIYAHCSTSDWVHINVAYTPEPRNPEAIVAMG